MGSEPTSDRLRDDIDKGRTGEKVDFPDPSAAPLGTDAEASGHSPSRAERKLEAADRPVGREERRKPGLWPYLAAVAAVGAVAVALVLFAA